MFHYCAYGLTVASDMELPQLLPGAQLLDDDYNITIQWGQFDLLSFHQDQPLIYLKQTPQETIVSIQTVGVFEIRDGQEILVTPSHDSDQRLVQLCMSGSILAILMYQRGFEILHSCAVSINAQAACFLGDSGEGKSTMLASLIARGHGLISDDVVPVQFSSNTVQVLPSYPQFKISPESATSLGYQLDDLVYLHPRLGEYAYRTTSFPKEPQPLKHIYILDSGSKIAIEPLSGQAAIMALVRNTYGIMTLKTLVAPDFHLKSCQQLAQQVKVWRLTRPRDLSLLSSVAELVEKHMLEMETVLAAA